MVYPGKDYMGIMESDNAFLPTTYYSKSKKQ